ncbi:beclin-1-like protein B [Drosophila subobscura]|uniref:beclin-1-like protein B n=1 Tax=Drosophila subobscura TaxID=7241 RepID=UPI00155AD4DC|nr:beclin-1-like protein B [Drosophila subobscura]
MSQTMDDMVYQCSNQNSIYVLNASYNAYGDLGTYAATKREINGIQSRAAAAHPIEATCSPSAAGVGVGVQHKFKSFGSATTVAAGAATRTGTLGGCASNYVNPVATSMSTTMCSPAATALQKLFNCSVSGNACQNVTHTHNNNTLHGSGHNNGCLSATRGSLCESGATGGASASGSGVGPPAGGAPQPLLAKKKCTNVKSTLIAKKTKFLKFLEEEKWRSAAAAAAAAEDEGREDISNEAEPSSAATSSTTSSFVGHSGVQGRNNNGRHLKNQSNSQEAAPRTRAAGGGGTGTQPHQQNKLNNWSMHNEDSNKLTNYPQQEQQQHQSYVKEQTKSSYELYQEAADILGLSCSLCDNCRCLDCQSGYFDCDDDDESYSEQSLMDDEYDDYDYSVEELQMLLTREHQLRQGPEQTLCYAVDCQQNCHLPQDEAQEPPAAGQGDAEPEPEPEFVGVSGHHRVAIDFDLINATCSQVLQNCETFNDLSLLDAAGTEQRPFT